MVTLLIGLIVLLTLGALVCAFMGLIAVSPVLVGLILFPIIDVLVVVRLFRCLFGKKRK